MIEWADPPYVGGWAWSAEFIDEIKANPGKWAKVPRTYTQSSMATILKNRYPGKEWTGRKRPDGRYDIYGRWVGES